MSSVHSKRSLGKWTWKQLGLPLGAALVFANCTGSMEPLSIHEGAEQAFPSRQGEVRTGTFNTAAGPRELTYELIDGKAVFEGDILLPMEHLAEVSASSVGELGAVRSSSAARWPNGVVPYTISPMLTNTARVTSAIAHWEQRTPIRFVQRTNETSFVTFQPGDGCSSSVGRVGNGQAITLGDGCSTGNTLHEIGHALGLWHEQSRSDRDEHVVIHWENILPFEDDNFETYVQKGADGRDLGPYNFGSIMHYGSNAFSVDPDLPTITRLDGSWITPNRAALSGTDVCTVKRLYGYGRRSDINGDGFADLVVGVAQEDVGAVTNAGAINIIYGAATGLSQTNVLLNRESANVEDTAGGDDYFGRTIATGDFNGDGMADVVAGVPFDDIGGFTDAGSVHLFYGSPTGASTASDVIWYQGSPNIPDPVEAGDLFGMSMAVGDFDGDGYDDLAVGVPSEDISGVPAAGAVNIFYGTSAGLSAARAQFFRQGVGGIPGVDELNDQFGSTLITGDFNGDGFDELAVGVPAEDVGFESDAGAVVIIPGTSSGLNGLGSQLWDESNAALPNAQASDDDNFGATLAAGDFNGDGIEDLAIGAPYEDAGYLSGAHTDSGQVTVLPGSSSGLRASQATSWNQDSPGIAEDLDVDDAFGYALVAGDVDCDGYDDLAVGVPYEDVEGILDAGAVHVLRGQPGGLSSLINQFWHQNAAGVPGGSEASDYFGYRLALGDYNADGFLDLAVGVPFENIEPAVNAGAVNVMFGNAVGLSNVNQQVWWQGHNGLQGVPATSDMFGLGL